MPTGFGQMWGETNRSPAYPWRGGSGHPKADSNSFVWSTDRTFCRLRAVVHKSPLINLTLDTSLLIQQWIRYVHLNSCQCSFWKKYYFFCSNSLKVSAWQWIHIFLYAGVQAFCWNSPWISPSNPNHFNNYLSLSFSYLIYILASTPCHSSVSFKEKMSCWQETIFSLPRAIMFFKHFHNLIFCS